MMAPGVQSFTLEVRVSPVEPGLSPADLVVLHRLDHVGVRGIVFWDIV